MSKLRVDALESLETGRTMTVDALAQTFNYAVGVRITSYNQYVRDVDGALFRVDGGTPLPYVLTGAGVVTESSLVSLDSGPISINVEDFGAIGDGSTDDTIAVLAAFTSAAAVGSVRFGHAKTYRLTESISVQSAMTVDLNGAVLNFDFGAGQGNNTGFTVNSDNVKIHNGEINVTGPDIGLTSASHVPIYGGNESNGESWKNLEFRDLTISTEGNGGIIFMGETTNVLVENIVIKDSAGIRNGIAFEWGGTPTVGTGHPHNIVINNVKVGSLTYPGLPEANYTCAVWLSSAFNVSVSNIYADATPTVVNVFTGDKSNVYAPASYKKLIGTNIDVSTVSCANVRGFGIRVYGKGTDSDTPLKQNVTLRNINLIGNPAIDYTHAGIVLEFCEGVTVQDFVISGFYYGILTASHVQDLRVLNGEISGAQYAGISIGSGVGPTMHTSVNNVRLFNNNKQLTEGVSSASAIRISSAVGTRISNCVFGAATGETQKYSISLTSDSIGTILTSNHTISTASGGVAYLIDSTSNQTIRCIGEGNTSEAGVTTTSGAPLYTLRSTGNVEFFTAVGIPTAGTWAVGDKLYYETPTASSFIGAVCVTAGSPGVWKNFGSISA